MDNVQLPTYSLLYVHTGIYIYIFFFIHSRYHLFMTLVTFCIFGRRLLHDDSMDVDHWAPSAGRLNKVKYRMSRTVADGKVILTRDGRSDPNLMTSDG